VTTPPSRLSSLAAARRSTDQGGGSGALGKAQCSCCRSMMLSTIFKGSPMSVWCYGVRALIMSSGCAFVALPVGRPLFFPVILRRVDIAAGHP
jgi:hypothetical protein